MAALYELGEQSAFESRYKSIESEQDTRNPTTNKKIHGTPVQFRRSNPYLSPDSHPRRSHAHSLSFSEKVNVLEREKWHCMRVGKIKKAEVLHNRIARAKSQQQQQRRRSVSREQVRQKRAVSAAHKSEMQHLHRLWNQYFRQLRQREIDILESFKNFQRQEIRAARDKLQQRCASARSHSRQRSELIKRQQQLMAQSRFKELRVVRKELLRLSQREQEARRRQAQRWAELQEERLSASQSRKYSALMSRLQQYRQDKEKIYLREQKRLRQKYKNVLAQLQHEQAMELSALNRMLTFTH